MYDALKEYKNLLDEGVITETEFEKKKRELLGMPDKEEQQRIIDQQRRDEEERQKAIDEAKRLEAEHKRRLEEEQIAEREHQRKLEEAKLAEQERKTRLEEEKRLEAERKKKEKEEKKAAKKGRGKIVLIAIIAIVVVVGAIFVINGLSNRGYVDTTNYNATFEWPESGLAKSVPKPTVETGEINNNHDTMLDFYLYKTTSDDYMAYVKACKDDGYTVIEEDSDTYYRAYNEAGDRYVDVKYYNDDSKIYVVVRAPEKWSDIYWPKSELAKTLPVPEKLYGIVNWDDSDSLDVDIANVTVAEFNAYIDKCIEAGYNIDYSRDDNSFSAENADGNELDIWYEYFNVMNIDADLAD